MCADINHRMKSVSESILSNETFTAEFEDEAADVLLNWALERGKEIVEAAVEMEDEAAEAAMYPRLKALRRIARYAGKLRGSTDDPAVLVAKIIDKAHDLYGPGFTAPNEEAQTAFAVQAQDTSPVDLVKGLIVFLQGDSSEESV